MNSLIQRTDRLQKNVAVPLQVGFIAMLLGVAAAERLASVAAIAATVPTVTIAQAPTVYVNPAFGKDEATAGNRAVPYRTITYALQQAKPGTTVQLDRGSYTSASGETFPLQVPAGVILRGEEADKGATMAIIGSGIFISRTFARQNVTILAGNNSEIRGVTVTNPSTRGTGIWIESTNPRIQNCTFTNNNREGIFITGTGNPKIVQNVFSLNGGNGISTANSAQGDIEDNVFQNTGFGLAIGGNSTPKISKNRIIENTDGLYINDNARPILRNNIIENNKRDGVVATIAAKPDLGTAESNGGNVIRNNRQFDLNNSTNGTLYSVGNTLSTQKIAGRVEFVAGEGQSTFADVQGNWAAAYIEALAKRNIITGFPDGSFRPDDPVTRAQYAAIINKAFAPAPKQAAIEFSDVNPSFWGYQPIQTAVTGGFLRGYPEGVFRPNQRIPKVQVLVALSTGLSFPAPTDFSTLSLFQDAGAIPDYARSAIATATQRRIVVNYPSVGLLQPNREATRAEVAALVYQALVTSGKAQAIASPYIVSP